ncbi:MAG: hypothetical protein OXH72_15160 [Caldilineaceae bacterium]|nr:hypothetical protein [Caldilineaceae bacterium]
MTAPKRHNRRFKFPGATPEALAEALLRPVQEPKEPEKCVSVQLGEDETGPDDPEVDTHEINGSGNATASLRDDPESSSTR